MIINVKNGAENLKNTQYISNVRRKDNTKNVVMGFNGSDYVTDLWVNGHHAITHRGGFAPFTVDITKYLVLGENKLVVRCYHW